MCREFDSHSPHLDNIVLVCSSMVERPAVNREVVGSSPAIPAMEAVAELVRQQIVALRKQFLRGFEPHWSP